MTERFDYEDKYITLNRGVFAEVKTVNDAELISKTFNQLIDENEQLKSRVEYLERKIDRERTSYQKQHEKWEEEIQKENEQLKHYKEAYGDEIVNIKTTIKTMMENERTEIGKNVLRQLWEAIQ